MRGNRLEQQIQHSLNAELSGLNTTSWQRNQFFENATGGTRVKRKLTYSLVLTIVLLLIAATALAAAITNGFGLMDFWKDTQDNVEIPEDAGQYIEHDLTVEETEHFTVRFRETSYDGKTCHVVYDVIPKSKELLLFDKPLDEYWYAQTHLNPDRNKMQEDGRTILDRWDEGGFTSGWQVDIDAGSDTEDIREYGSGGVLDEETGIYTGSIDVPLESLKEERTLWFSVRMLPMKDMHDEYSMDYDHEEHVYMERTFHAAVSGEEVILVNISPVLFSSIGVQVDQIRLMVLPQEIQYQIDYSLTDAALYHSLFDEHPDADHTVTVHPSFRFVKIEQNGAEPVILPRGVTHNYIGYDTMKGSVLLESDAPQHQDEWIYVDFVNEDESVHLQYFTNSIGQMLGLMNVKNTWQGENNEYNFEEYSDKKLVQETEEKLLKYLADENPDLAAMVTKLKTNWWYQDGEDLYLHYWEEPENLDRDAVDFVVRVAPEWRIEFFSCVGNG